MTSRNADLDRKLSIMVGRYAIPLALALVCAAIALSQPTGRARETAIVVALLGVTFNFVANRAVDAGTSALVKWRMWINLALNGALVWLLGSVFQPVWLLLALTPIASAVYGDRRRTVTLAAVVAAMLLAFTALRGPASPLEWGHAGAHAFFVIVVSMLIDELSSLVRGHRS